MFLSNDSNFSKVVRVTVNFTSFRPATIRNIRQSGECISKPLNHELQQAPKQKQGFWNTAKNKFISFRKALIDIGYLTMGTLKGAIFGSVAGAGVAGGVALRNIIKKAPKTLGLGGKILAGTVAVAVLAGSIFKSKLDANEAKANLDHRWDTGHNEQ